ncbi:MAG: acyltransferase family protein [Amaricoccus sp.]
MKYRSEIDGLRAVAVIPVILFHAGFGAFSGGFVGVDVFFVLSGYLITSILLAELAQGRFSIARFYERRARRILPALYFVMLATLPFAFHLMLPDEFAGFCRTAISVIFFVSNIYFWQTTGYFARTAEENPLLHTWSLAVEEQYYVLFPIGLYLVWRWRAKGAWIALALGSLASLVLADYLSRRAPIPNFFLLSSRAWELGIGGMAALWLHQHGPARPSRLGDAGAALGLAMILASVALFDAGTRFPSLYALVPTVGTALVVLYGRPDGSAGRLLSLKPVVFVGLISYSAYLWHQPLFAFARIARMSPPGPWLMGWLSLLSLLLATLTWRYVERPFRDKAAIDLRRLIVSGVAASAGLLLLAGLGPWLASADWRYPARDDQFVKVSRADRATYVEQGYRQFAGADFRDDGRPKLLIIGDSFSEDFYNMLHENGAFADYQIATRRVGSNCQLYLGPEDVTRYLDPPVRSCAMQEGAKDFVAIAQQADVVVFAVSWRKWSGARIMETIANFHLRPDQTVLVIGRKNFGYVNLRALLRLDPDRLPGLRNKVYPEHLETNAEMEQVVDPALFVDTQAILCGQGDTCPIVTPSGELITFDGTHLTQAGAKYVGSLLFRDPRLAPFAPQAKASL